MVRKKQINISMKIRKFNEVNVSRIDPLMGGELSKYDAVKMLDIFSNMSEDAKEFLDVYNNLDCDLSVYLKDGVANFVIDCGSYKKTLTVRITANIK